MWVHANLVFGKENRISHLANIVVKRTCTDELPLCVYLAGNLNTKVSHRDGMLESSRSHFAQSAQQLVVGVGKLEHRYRRYETEELFNNQHQRISKEQ